MIAGRGGDHAAGALLRRERQQLVERAALLEAGGELVVLELEVDLRPGMSDKVRECRQGVCTTLPPSAGRRRIPAG
jgi:hypothetical protein